MTLIISMNFLYFQEDYLIISLQSLLVLVYYQLMDLWKNYEKQ